MFLSVVWEHFSESKRNRGLSLSSLSFDCSYSIFKLFCFLLTKFDVWPDRAVNRRCISARVCFRTKVNGITDSVLAQVLPHYILPFFKRAVTTTHTLLDAQAIGFEMFIVSFSKVFMDQKVSHSMIQCSPVMQIGY